MRRPTNLDTVQEFWNADTLNEIAASVGNSSRDEFLQRLKAFLKSSAWMRLEHSASRGLLHLLQAVRSDAANKVLLCDFNCPKVADSVLAAGCEIELYDFDRPDGMIDWERVGGLLGHDHAAIIVAHFFGVPTDFRPLLDRAQRLGVKVIEDCAHCLGGMIEGETAGTIGNAAIFSFNYDKPISLGGGGAILVKNPEIIAKLVALDEPPDPKLEAQELKRFLKYLEQRRRDISRQRDFMRRAIRRLPVARGLIRPQPFEPASGIGTLRAKLGVWQIERYPAVLDVRNANAEKFAADANVRTWHVGDGVRPAWLKQKCYLPPPIDVLQLSIRLQTSGYRVGRFNWPRSMSGYLKRAQNCPVAEEIASRSVDCPIHQEVGSEEIEFLASELSC